MVAVWVIGRIVVDGLVDIVAALIYTPHGLG